LHRLPNADGLGVSRKHRASRRAFCAPQRYAEELCEDGRKRQQRRHAFCGNCGTPIYACAVHNPQTYALRVGTITQRAAFTPQRQSWRRSALDWVDTLAAVPATEKGWTG
jgi:hypothetical protein